MYSLEGIKAELSRLMHADDSAAGEAARAVALDRLERMAVRLETFSRLNPSSKAGIGTAKTVSNLKSRMAVYRG